MTISVIIPTYNRAATVAEAVRSALAQSVRPHEVIVVDDGSTDGTHAALAPLAGDVVLVRQANAGVAAARNAGLRQASGRWVAFLDSDDVWLPGWLATLAHGIATLPAAGVIVADLVFEGPGYEQSLFAIRRFAFADGMTEIARPLGHAISGLSLIAAAVRRDWLLEAGGFDEQLRMYEDLDLLLRLALAGPWGFTPFVASRAKRRPEPAGHALTAAAARNRATTSGTLARILARIAGDARLTADERELVARKLSGALFGEARALQATGLGHAAIGPLVASARRHPSLLTGWGKAAALGLLGAGPYDRLSRARRGFHREDYEA